MNVHTNTRSGLKLDNTVSEEEERYMEDYYADP